MGRFLAGFRTGCNLIASIAGGVYRNLKSDCIEIYVLATLMNLQLI